MSSNSKSAVVFFRLKGQHVLLLMSSCLIKGQFTNMFRSSEINVDLNNRIGRLL